ncbi:hypothetical protein GCM10009730_32770 [Streptomyces albidochromogenes]
MDQGWSALIAGMAGLVGAVLGGYIAKQGAVAGARATAEATARQVELQGRNELAHWIRQERRAAYGEVVRAYSVLANQLAAYRVAVGRGTALDDLSDQVDDARNALVIACSSTHLFGPEAVWDAAYALRSTAQQGVLAHRAFAHHSQAGSRSGLEDARRDLSGARVAMRESLISFSERCRQALLSEHAVPAPPR